MGERKRDKVKRNCRKKGVKYEKQQNEEKGEKSVRIRGRKELKQEESMRKEKNGNKKWNRDTERKDVGRGRLIRLIRLREMGSKKEQRPEGNEQRGKKRGWEGRKKSHRSRGGEKKFLQIV